MTIEEARRRMGNWTFDDIAESVLANYEISISLTEAILAVVDMARLGGVAHNLSAKAPSDGDRHDRRKTL
jgi:hypothetical protein